MRIDESTPFIVFGAGHNGCKIYENLKKNKCNVVAFIDNNIEITEYKGIPVLKMNELVKIKKDNTIVILSLLNYFEHEKIAKKLRKLGFEYLIFKNDLLLVNKRKKSIELNSIYDRIYQGNSIIGYEISNLNNNYFNYFINDSGVFKNLEERLICYLPVELLFFKEYQEQELQHIFINSERMDLFSLFDGSDSNNYEETIENYCYSAYKSRGNGRLKIDKVPKEFCERILASRYDVYQKMKKAYDLNPAFFLENPPIAKYLGNSKFLIVDGTHRLSFLMLRGKKNIPCLVSKEDYEYWKNDQISNVLLDTLKKSDKKSIYNFILNPNFFHIEYEFETLCRDLIIPIINVLKPEIIRKKIKMLELDAKSSYFATVFNIMGIKTEIILSKEYDIKVAQIIQNLYNVEISSELSIKEELNFDYFLIFNHILEYDKINLLFDFLVKNKLHKGFFLIKSDEIKRIKDSYNNYSLISIYNTLYLTVKVSLIFFEIKKED